MNLLPERLDQPLRWRKPRRVFVCSMSDLFHPDVPTDFIDSIFAVIALAGYTRKRRSGGPQRRAHTFQILTKRPERMADYLDDPETANRVWIAARRLDPHGDGLTVYHGHLRPGLWEKQELSPPEWPLPWLWLGTSVEDQQRADERIPHLLRCPAAVRFLSCEPLLAQLDLGRWFRHDAMNPPGIVSGHSGYRDTECHWVIVGGESGPGARPMDVAWARSIVRQCADAGVACFVKQVQTYRCPDCGCCTTSMPEWPSEECDACHEKARRVTSHAPAEWPEDLRVRQMPMVASDV